MIKSRVIIARDRLSSGGGIHNYYNAISNYLSVDACYINVGKPQEFYCDLGLFEKLLSRFTLPRLLFDWFSLFIRIILHRPQIVHVNPGLDATTRKALKRDAASIIISKLCCRKTIVFWRGWDADWVGQAEFPGGNSGMLSRIYRLADIHIVLSSSFKDDLRKWGFSKPIYLETTVVSDESIDRNVQQRELNPNNIDILFLSRIEMRKGIVELLESYKILKRWNPAFSLTFAGDGPDLQALKSHCDGIEDIRILGYVSGAEKRKCFQRASFFCFLSSYGEGMPNAVLEGLAAGLPVIASPAGGLRDILEDGKTGYVINQTKELPNALRFDPEEVARRIRQIAENPSYYARISGHNIEYAKNRFTAPVVAQRLESIYAEALGKHANGRELCKEGELKRLHPR